MMKICDCADEDGTNIFPSVATIQRETGLGQSTVRECIAAFEEAGLLIVKANKFGNRQGKTTTIRELDTDRLRLITGKRRRGQTPIPSTHVLRRGEIDIPARSGDSDETISVFVPGAALPSYVDARGEPRVAQAFALFLRDEHAAGEEGTPPASGGVDAGSTPPVSGGAPLQPLEGYPSSQWTPPLQPVEGTPPVAGPNPSLDPSLKDSPPPPRRRRGVREDGLLDEVRKSKRHCGRAFEKLLAPLLTRLPLKAPKPTQALEALADLAEAQQDDVLDEALSLLTTPGTKNYREFDVRVPNIEGAIDAANKIITNRKMRDHGPLLWRGSAAFNEAIAKVQAVHPEFAWELSQRDMVKRSELKAYGVEQQP